MKNIILTLLLLSSLLANAQNPPQDGPHRLQFVDTRLNFKYILSDVTKPDTVGFEEFIVPEGVKAGEKYIVRYEKLTTSAPVVEKIDGELATFSAGWARSLNNPGWYQNSIAYSNVAGSTVSYTFTGTKVELFAERLASHGVGNISIDNGTATQVSFKVAPFGLPVKIWESAVLPNGSHTIKLTCVSGYVLLDYFQIVK
jgi:hypothetical protein